MSTALARIAEATGFDRTKVELVKDTIAKGASDDELMLFLSLAQRSGLDPFSRQIYLIERRQNVDGQWKTARQPQTGIDGLRLIADRTGNYAPGRAPTYEYTAEGRLHSATAYILKWVRGQWHEVAATAHYEEYVQTKKDGAPTQMWADKPHIMLAKCAEALALRRAFPADMNGLYTSDEIRDEPAAVLVHQPPRPQLPPAPAANTATGEVVEGAAFDPEREAALNEMRAAARRAKKAGADIALPDKAAVGVMTLDEIRTWTGVYAAAADEQEAAPAAA